MRQRAGTVRHAAKKLARKSAKPRPAPKAEHRPDADLQEQVRALTRELIEAREQQIATSKVLQVISSSPGELQSVFDFMLGNAVRICDAKFGVLFRSEGDALRAVALYNAPAPFAEERRRNPLMRPSPVTTLGRAV